MAERQSSKPQAWQQARKLSNHISVAHGQQMEQRE